MRGKAYAFTACRHSIFSSRTPFDRDRTLWSGWVVEYADGPVYFAGDTGFGNHFAAINAQFEAYRSPRSLLVVSSLSGSWDQCT